MGESGELPAVLKGRLSPQVRFAAAAHSQLIDNLATLGNSLQRTSQQQQTGLAVIFSFTNQLNNGRF